MGTGYMTLPKPAYANTKWAEYLVAIGNANLTQNSYKRYPRSTPSIYWAMLYNRAFEIIDKHDHSLTNDGNAGLSTGRNLTTYDLDPGYWGGNRSRWLFTSNLDMKMGFEDIASYQNIDNSWGFKQDSPSTTSSYGTLSFEPIISSEMQYRSEGPFAGPSFGSMPLGLDDLPDDLRDPTNYKYSFFARLDYNFGIESDSTTSTWYASNFNAFPSIPICWTTGDKLTPILEILNNIPGGAIPGLYQYSGFPNSSTDSEMYNKANTLQPFIGVVDKGVNGYEWSYATNTTTVNLYPYYNQGRGWFASWQASYSLTGTINLIDVPEALDPCTDYRLLDVVEADNYGVGNNAYTYFSYYIPDSGYTPRPHWSFGATWRYGKFLWINDMSGAASTYNQTITVTPDSTYSTAVTNIRWHGNTAAPKHWSSDGTGTDLLKLESNNEAFMIVKATDTLWFAYFK